MQHTITYTKTELSEAIREAFHIDAFDTGAIREMAIEGFCARFSNVFISPDEVANMHGVGIATVRRYIADRLIPVEPHADNERYRIRLSDALRLDFKELRKQLKTINQ
ncbi:MAG: helix-turn-helix domain-containing protein [Prevotellaceae bacterium]|nr:helix-turn-helix domain-containing protein [Prevotellaceae bacterium]